MKSLIQLTFFFLIFGCTEENIKLNPSSDSHSKLASGNESEKELKEKAAERQKAFELAQEELNNSLTSFSVDTEEYDFGIIPKNTPVSKIFLITNTGKNPLVITDAKASCGCTVPKKPEEPIGPGMTGELEVTFTSKPGQEGTSINKTVTVTANIPGGNKKLVIKGQVTK